MITMQNVSTTSPFIFEDTVDRRAKRILILMGVSAISIGCDYLCTAISEAYRDPEITLYTTKTLYPRIARLHGGKKASTVYRDMLRTVHKWKSEVDTEAKIKYLGSRDAPTDIGSIVSLIAHYLRCEDGLE